jgi:hypothetical protein
MMTLQETCLGLWHLQINKILPWCKCNAHMAVPVQMISNQKKWFRIWYFVRIKNLFIHVCAHPWKLYDTQESGLKKKHDSHTLKQRSIKILTASDKSKN